MKEDYYLMITCALRYALGRHTYICKTVADYIKAEKNIPEHETEIMIKDINNHFNNPIAMDYEHECDRETWLDLMEYLTKITKKEL